MWYSGIDLHRDNSYLTTVDQSGCIVKQKRLPNVPALLMEYFASIGSDHAAVVESTTGWYWLNDLLESHGIPLTLAHAKHLKAIAYAKVKTDKVDSHTLALLLQQNFIPKAHKISPALRGMRDTLRIRLRLVERRTACKRQMESISAKLNDPEAFPEDYAVQRESLAASIQSLSAQVCVLEKSLHARLIPNDDIQRLLQVPGIGKLTAFSIYLEVDGIERFGSDKHFVSYCRLVPAADNSNRRRTQRSSKDGNVYLKIAFSNAAIHAIQYYPEIRASEQSLPKNSRASSITCSPITQRFAVSKDDPSVATSRNSGRACQARTPNWKTSFRRRDWDGRR
jgi:transposase